MTLCNFYYTGAFRNSRRHTPHVDTVYGKRRIRQGIDMKTVNTD
jgi:hypothetical protein